MSCPFPAPTYPQVTASCGLCTMAAFTVLWTP